MARYNFFINGVIRAGDEVDARMFLQELIADDNMHTSLPVGINWKPIEMFEVTVQEIED